ncbi:hypothetical protein HZH68_003334 [Vespula germanica]|uniref:Uncharacterized protein n=1 Tax=Vespula germanica TaxID=30212 RepID=A0A834NP78_VESGE|nr:hypothetical protein HZH68_003334 [Vespula germanica]
MSPLGGEERMETLLHLPFPRDILFSTLVALLTNEKPTSSSSPRDLFALKFAQDFDIAAVRSTGYLTAHCMRNNDRSETRELVVATEKRYLSFMPLPIMSVLTNGNPDSNSIKKSCEGENLDLETRRLLSLQTSLPKPTLYETSTKRKEAYVLQSSTFADDNFFQALANERSMDAAKGANGYIPSYTVVKRQD